MPTKADEQSEQIRRKAAVVEEIRAKLAGSDAALLTEYRGLTVTEIAGLRDVLRPTATEYKVFKNTLARRAAQEAGLDELIPMLEGPVAIAFIQGDAVPAAKALRDYAKATPALQIKGGLLGPRILFVDDVEALADLPPRDILLARLAAGMQAPLTKAAGLFQAFTRNMAYGVKALIDLRIESGEVPPASDDVSAEVDDEAVPATAEIGSAEGSAESESPPEETGTEASTEEGSAES